MYSHDPILPHVQTFWEYALACISSFTFHPNINNPILPHVQTFQEYKLTCLPWGNTLMCACIEKRLNGKEEGRFIWDTFHLCWCCPVGPSSARARSTLMLSFRDGKRQIKFLFSRKICRIFLNQKGSLTLLTTGLENTTSLSDFFYWDEETSELRYNFLVWD